MNALANNRNTRNALFFRFICRRSSSENSSRDYCTSSSRDLFITPVIPLWISSKIFLAFPLKATFKISPRILYGIFLKSFSLGFFAEAYLSISTEIPSKVRAQITFKNHHEFTKKCIRDVFRKFSINFCWEIHQGFP